MSRFTMTLAAAAASAVAAIAAVALPAVGADSKTPRRQAEPARATSAAFVSCLRSHGLADAPADPAALKPWLGAKEASDRRHREGRHGGVRRQGAAQDAPTSRRGPTSRSVIACVRGHGVDAPTEPDAFKRWLEDSDGLERHRRRPARLQDEPWPPDRQRAR